jgi:hypothetical protein
MICELQDKVFTRSEDDFEGLALEIFRFQYRENSVYRSFTDALGINANKVNSLTTIPFLPVSFFKHHDVVTGMFDPEAVFESSGTTNTGNSRHIIHSLALYRESFIKGFELFYGDIKEWCILGLLPSYLERQNSSLVLMVDELIKLTRNADSGFYLYNHDELIHVINKNENAGQKTLLIGVTFALLDLAEKFSTELKCTTVMETGGMKGRRKEITRAEVHELLQSSWGIKAIHSEYGMSELLSQAYSYGNGIFNCPPWMKIILRDEDDPLTISHSKQGLINVIDFANLYSCSFIATDDIGKLYPDGSFEVNGRMDSSDIRGCSLMYT